MVCRRTSFLAILQTIVGLLLLAAPGRAAGPHGVDIGWSVNNDGTILLTSAKCATLSQAGTGWLRVSMRLIPGHDTWDPTLFGLYDTAIDNCRRGGLQVILLIDGESWRGGQAAWTSNNFEHTGNSGDNDYLEGYAYGAVVPIVQHFRDRTRIFELWNEPNAWTRSPAPGVYEGGSFIYPSNFAALLTDSWLAIHVVNDINDVQLVAGGVFGHSIGNVYSYSRAGAQYLDDTYNVGINAIGSFAWVMHAYGSYPLDGIGQHIYIDQGRLTTTDHVSQYLQWVRQAYTRYEGDASPKQVFITELGWTTASVSPETQAANLDIAFQAIEATPWVRTTIWFNWQDGGGSFRYGVVDSSGNPKPSYEAYGYHERYEGRFADGTTEDGILTYYLSHYEGLGQSTLGNPYDAGGTAWVHAWGEGFTQNLDGGSDGTLAIMSSWNGTFEVNNTHGLWDFYSANDGIDNLGYPVGNEQGTGWGTRQDFERGFLTWDPFSGVTAHDLSLGAQRKGP
jgi:hypothetical protein